MRSPLGRSASSPGRPDYAITPGRREPPGPGENIECNQGHDRLRWESGDGVGSMERSLFSYIWRHSRPEQIVILVLVVLAQVFYFLSLSVPKSIVNNGITGLAFKDHPTIPFLVWELDLSAIFPGKIIRILDGFQ